MAFKPVLPPEAHQLLNGSLFGLPTPEPGTLRAPRVAAADIDFPVRRGDKRWLRRPTKKWRRHQLLAGIGVFVDSLLEAQLWPFQRWTGKLDTNKHLEGLGLGAWFAERYNPQPFNIDPNQSALMRMIPFENSQAPIGRTYAQPALVIGDVDLRMRTITVTRDTWDDALSPENGFTYTAASRARGPIKPRSSSRGEKPSRVPAGLQRKPWER